MSQRTAISIGNFDGVHLGHAALIRRARELVGPTGLVLALAFDPHPAAILRPQSAPPRLTTFPTRERLLRAGGASRVVRLEPTPQLLDLSPRQFVEKLVAEHRPAWFVEGADFKFGKGRQADLATLAELGGGLGFKVETVAPVTAALTDGMGVPVSSSLIRWLLEHGRVGDAAAALGHPYSLEGAVGEGDRRGRTIGVPTANLRVAPGTVLPADGVYAARATLPSGAVFPAAVNIGTRPTFDGADRRVEAHVILPQPTAWQAVGPAAEYGWPLALDFIAYLRDQVKFEGVGALTAQLARDIARAREIAADSNSPSIPNSVQEPVA